MSLNQSIQQKLLQKLSPQQIQLMKLLQVPTANLEERIKELEAKVRQIAGRNASNSSTPPSANPPGAPKPVQKEATGRKPGGQPGHAAQTREFSAGAGDVQPGLRELGLGVRASLFSFFYRRWNRAVKLSWFVYGR